LARSGTRIRQLVTPRELDNVTSREILLSTSDGYPLAARIWAPANLVSPVATALINSGAGISCRYYDHFASYLAANGIATLVYDYRGVGRSRPLSLRGFSASIEDWGSKDCAAGLEWLAARFTGIPRIVIGHSVGGFVTGFADNGHLIDQMLLVGAHNGYWRDYHQKYRLRMYLLWHLLMPALTCVIGFFPGRALHLLEDLPLGVAIEWANRRRPEFWWNVKTPEGVRDTNRINAAIARFQAIRARTLAVHFTDDPFATSAATDRVLALYPNCQTQRMLIGRADTNAQPIGHFGFFRSRFRDTLWPRVLAWLLNPDATVIEPLSS
jgi:predicted alpha/beta hydrolase